MNEFDDHRMDEGLDEVGRRLSRERPWATDLELDRAKVTAMSRAARPRAGAKRGFRPRVVSTLVAAGLLVVGAIGVGAGSGGLPSVSFTQSKSVNSQYCPPSSPGAGKPKNGANKCGQP